MAKVDMAAVDPVLFGRFKIAREDKVVTAGSCFAQHIARNLSKAGFNFHVTETAHPLARPSIAADYGYGMFSARYGNIYTSRQLLQLFRRAGGEFLPEEDFWTNENGRYIDPFRPSIQPGGYLTLEEFRADRQQHFAAVMKAFHEMDVFVFTLGLTECWASRTDGAVYPLCPGVVAGDYDPDRYRYLNLSVDEVVADFLEFFDRISAFNQKFKCILTVSPVPLIATAEKKHVLVSTTYSKAVLRVAAEIIERERPDSVAYFPSYEIITGNHARGNYYGSDLRSVTEDGVNHVMRLFFRHYASVDSSTSVNREAPPVSDHDREMRELVQVQCDEEALDRDAAP